MDNKKQAFGINYSRTFKNIIVYTKEDLIENLNKWNGKDQCYVSLNEFEVIDGVNPAWNYAVFDRLLIECNYDSVVNLLNIVKDAEFKKQFNFGYSVWYIGNNKFYWFFLLKNELEKIFPLVDEIEVFLKQRGVEDGLNRKPDKKILMLGTYNLLTKRIVTSIGEEEIQQGLDFIDAGAVKK